MRLTAIMLLFVLLGGCVTTSSVTAPADLVSAAPEQTGILYGSVGIADSGIRYAELTWRRKGGKATGSIQAAMPGIGEAQAGKPFALRLPAGEYEIVGYEVLQSYEGSSGPTTTRWTPDRPMAVPFRIAEGGATYLGELQAHPEPIRYRKLFWFFRIAERVGIHFRVSDQSVRDRAALEAAGTMLFPAADRTDNASMRLIHTGAPAFRAG